MCLAIVQEDRSEKPRFPNRWVKRWKVFRVSRDWKSGKVQPQFPNYPMWPGGEPLDTVLKARSYEVLSLAGQTYVSGFHTYRREEDARKCRCKVMQEIICPVYVQKLTVSGLQDGCGIDVVKEMIIRSRDWHRAQLQAMREEGIETKWRHT